MEIWVECVYLVSWSLSIIEGNQDKSSVRADVKTQREAAYCLLSLLVYTQEATAQVALPTVAWTLPHPSLILEMRTDTPQANPQSRFPLPRRL